MALIQRLRMTGHFFLSWPCQMAPMRKACFSRNHSTHAELWPAPRKTFPTLHSADRLAQRVRLPRSLVYLARGRWTPMSFYLGLQKLQEALYKRLS